MNENKPLGYKNYGSIPHLSDSKIYSVCNNNSRGGERTIGRAGYIANTSPYNQHQLFHKWVIDNYDRFDKLLEEGERLCGEWMYQVCTLNYKLTHEPFVAFDLFLNKEERLDYISFIKRVSKFDIIIPHLVSIGPPISTNRAMKLLGNGGHGCKEIPEGVVYRLEKDKKVEFLAKFIREGKLDGVYLDDNIIQEGAKQ